MRHVPLSRSTLSWLVCDTDNSFREIIFVDLSNFSPFSKRKRGNLLIEHIHSRVHQFDLALRLSWATRWTYNLQVVKTFSVSWTAIFLSIYPPQTSSLCWKQRLFRQQPEVRLPVIEALLGQVPSTTIEVKVFAFDIEVVEIFSAQSVAEWLGQGKQSLFSTLLLFFANSKVSDVYHPPKSQKHQVEVWPL